MAVRFTNIRNTKMAVRFHMIPYKLVKIANHVLCSPLPNANSLLEGVSSDDAKITYKKNGISNFKSDSILTTFSNLYKKVAKRSLEEDINTFLSSFLFVYKQNYSTEYALIRLVEELCE